ncbi:MULTISPECIES: M48 family metallopeptidase [unclassified Methylobacterium]|uniref:M48 family metalloprotease n=1 Tax=unclassified Methylobacterium TaxID=2615210 RepID=UPI0011C1D2B5|nr:MULTISPECIES: M48 family metallopeptidase [unclassified Methylobacterium]QEE41341.1 M48 family metalloprotease [Methylobacterium sp. WL1]TXN57771.1 M48 family metalloprotease [Methylobacterium sp. WL2]
MIIPVHQDRRGSRRLPPVVWLVAWVVGVPALLGGLGAWEVERGLASAESYTRRQVELPVSVVQLRLLAATDPYASVRFEGGRTAYGAALATDKAQEALAVVTRDLPLARARAWVPYATLGGALLALLAGLVALAGGGAAGLWARRSRDALLASFGLVRRVLPVLLGLQIVGLSLAVLAAALFEATGLWFTQRFSAGEAKLLLGALVIAALAAWAAVAAVRGLRGVFALFTPEPIDVRGRVLDEADAPGLWRLVRELAGRGDSLVPDAVVVGLTGGFFVTESAVRLSPDTRTLTGRTLYLPAPYLGVLDGRELSAVIGHELAHFAGEDTAYSRRFTPIYAGLHRALTALGNVGPGDLLTRPAAYVGYRSLGTFDAAVARWSRAREFEADRRGAQVSGAPPAASALLRVGVLGPVVGETLASSYGKPDAAPDDLVAGVLDAIPVAGFPEPGAHLDDRQAHPTDTHPSDRQRIAALGVPLDAELFARAARPLTVGDRAWPAALVADWTGLCRWLSVDFLTGAREHRAAERVYLEETAAAVPVEETVVHENGAPMVWTMGVLALLFAGAGAALLLYPRALGVAHDALAQQILGAAAAAGVAWAGIYAGLVHRRGRTPLLVLTPDVLRSPLLDSAVAWKDVADFQVTHGKRLTLTLALTPDATLPRTKRLFSQAGVSRRRRHVCVQSLGSRGLKPDAFAALVGRYLAASRARVHLSAAHTGI